MPNSNWDETFAGAVDTIRLGRHVGPRVVDRWRQIEAIRAELETSTRVLQDIDHGAGADGARAGEAGPTRYRLPVWRVAKASVQPPVGRLLFELVRRARPRYCLEMGTNLGISGMYVASALADNGFGRLKTLDAAPTRVAIARDGFDRVAPGIVETVVGPFERTMAPALSGMGQVDFAFVDGNHREEPTLQYFQALLRYAHSGTLLVFDDITASAGMRRAWQEICASARLEAAAQIALAGKHVLGLAAVGVSDGIPSTRTFHLDRPLTRILSMARRRAGRLLRRVRRGA